MHRVMVVGASGLLGQHMMSAGTEMGLAMTGTYNTVSELPGTIHMDITDPDSVSRGLMAACPEMVVLCAAMTNVDQCEREPDAAYKVNMEGALNIASECRSAGVKLVYISTDYVFNGLKGQRYHEFEPADPLSVYAKSKLEGERVTLDASRSNLVCRVSVVYGWNRLGRKSNFVTWVIDSLRKGQEIRLYDDQFVSPTYAPSAARDILELSLGKLKGICHTSGPDCISRYDIGTKVAETFGLNASLIRAVSTAEMPLLAKRPAVSCLGVDLAESELGRPMVDLRKGLAMMRESE
ncbi:MAG: dTDP-4-dehydrorhamnose reductase [Methanomassiliicoccales archaeon PtaB.Bin215]|nr:MAG: dTDP-4-dehydrorhamnose reductase [Methanomassiliicoccales archaeon PtaB.Bin215]